MRLSEIEEMPEHEFLHRIDNYVDKRVAESGSESKADALREYIRVNIRPHDNPGGHIEEDRVRDYALRMIAGGDFGEASELAKAALATADIEFDRWYE
jgi:hypothetical protein